ncbi:hypothetical protein HanXRQr2_Chr15g0697721 [Helianthus annuus]|uniref:Uncharacterized protein n=1 Tax=Helianthus annuus TaxID=4232 RepID=A0A9K3E0W5_HELAN|nr:hypothetical protein HanXRQr2_Chr15g0697721 [Helianthus annuus]KAJ0831649.1 hypothetical protein HanPSC8_Chr15g0669441 [Helianthus annuus]
MEGRNGLIFSRRRVILEQLLSEIKTMSFMWVKNRAKRIEVEWDNWRRFEVSNVLLCPFAVGSNVVQPVCFSMVRYRYCIVVKSTPPDLMVRKQGNSSLYAYRMIILMNI